MVEAHGTPGDSVKCTACWLRTMLVTALAEQAARKALRA